MDAVPDGARPRLAPGVRLQMDEATDKNVLLFPEGVLELNETAEQVLLWCDGRTVRGIAEALAEEYEIEFPTLVADVREIIGDLERRKLVKLT